MARKSLLTESEIRRFMKLASMQPVGVDRMQSLHEQPEDLGPPPPEGDLGAEEGLPPGPEAAEAEMDVEEEPVEDEGDPEKEAMLADVVQAVADVLGVDVDVEGAGEEEELGMAPEDELEMGAEEEVPLEGGEELEMGAEEEVPGQRDMYEGATQEQIVNEVAKRVAARLSKEAQRDQAADQLAERILKRLTK